MSPPWWPARPGWAASQEVLAALSTNSRRRIIAGATHASLIDGRGGPPAPIVAAIAGRPGDPDRAGGW